MKHSKVLHITHPRREIQEYLEANDHNVQESKFLFSLRSRMVDVRANYREKYFVTICPCCELEEDSQEHLLSCDELRKHVTVPKDVQYKDIYGNTDKQLKIVKVMKQLLRKRELLRST